LDVIGSDGDAIVGKQIAERSIVKEILKIRERAHNHSSFYFAIRNGFAVLYLRIVNRYIAVIETDLSIGAPE
jgi:hypothetical protein